MQLQIIFKLSSPTKRTYPIHEQTSLTSISSGVEITVHDMWHMWPNENVIASLNIEVYCWPVELGWFS